MPKLTFPCSRCGTQMVSGPGSLGPGRSTCLKCRRSARSENKPLRVCTVEGCHRRVHARDMCGAHYEAQRVGVCTLPEAACMFCSTTFRPRHVKHVYCSKACRWNHRDAGRMRGHTKHRDEVTARDHGICQLCGRPVDPSLVFPDRWSATLDHIIPSSLGGSDDITNLRLAHLTCNASRQARAA